MNRLVARAAFVVVALGLVVVGAIVVVALGVGVPPPATARPATPTTAVATATAAPTPTPSPTPPPSPTPSPSPSPLVSARGNIAVEQPRAGARVGSPLAVAGRARVFEAALVWRLVDQGGREIAKGFTTASVGAPDFGTFAIPIAFHVNVETAATVEVFTNSPRDGSVDEIVRVPVMLLP